MVVVSTVFAAVFATFFLLSSLLEMTILLY